MASCSTGEPEEDPLSEPISGEKVDETEHDELSPSQRARIERNRQRALLLKQARVASRPYPDLRKSSEKATASKKAIDTGAGFLLEEEDDEPKVITVAQTPVYLDTILCEECSKPYDTSYIYEHFGLSVCDSCRDNEDKHRLISRTDAKEEFLLKDSDIDAREPPLRYILRKNPHNPRWGDMKLYLYPQVAKRAEEVHGGDDALEEAKDKRTENRVKTKQKRYEKKLKGR